MMYEPNKWYAIYVDIMGWGMYRIKEVDIDVLVADAFYFPEGIANYKHFLEGDTFYARDSNFPVRDKHQIIINRSKISVGVTAPYMEAVYEKDIAKTEEEKKEDEKKAKEKEVKNLDLSILGIFD